MRQHVQHLVATRLALHSPYRFALGRRARHDSATVRRMSSLGSTHVKSAEPPAESKISEPIAPPTNEELKKTQSLKHAMQAVQSQKHIFICIDTEEWEKSKGMATEVGISVYDPSVQHGAKSIWSAAKPYIWTKHFIVAEHRDRFNGVFVSDNKFSFAFGQSMVMKKILIRQVLNRLLTCLQNRASENNMTLAVVGHQLRGDTLVLNNLGVTLPNKCAFFDTLDLWHANKKFRRGSLAYILTTLQIPHGLLHNAGNDAHYTMLVFLLLTCRDFRTVYRLDEPLPEPETPLKKTKRPVPRSLSYSNMDKAFSALELWWTPPPMGE